MTAQRKGLSTLFALGAGLAAGFLVGHARSPEELPQVRALEAEAAVAERQVAAEEAKAAAAESSANESVPEEVVAGPNELVGYDSETGAAVRAPKPATCGGPEQRGLEALEEKAERDLARYAGAEAGRNGPRMGQQVLREKLPVMPGGGPLIPMGDELVANGLPLTLASFDTRASAGDILEYYARYFEQQKWSWQGPEANETIVPHPSVTATDAVEQVQLSVLVMNHGDGTGSTVVLGLADMLANPGAPGAAGTADLPVYPGTEPVTLAATDESAKSLTVSFLTDDPAEKVEAFYRARLAEQGYRDVDDHALEGDRNELRVLRYATNDRLWSLTIAQRRGETSVTALGSAKEDMP